MLEGKIMKEFDEIEWTVLKKRYIIRLIAKEYSKELLGFTI